MRVCCLCACVHLFKIIKAYYIDRDCLSPLSICVSQLYGSIQTGRVSAN